MPKKCCPTCGRCPTCGQPASPIQVIPVPMPYPVPRPYPIYPRPWDYYPGRIWHGTSTSTARFGHLTSVN